MALRDGNKSSSDPSMIHKSRISSKKKFGNGDSLRNELHGMIPDLSSSNGPQNEENNNSSDSTSSSAPSSDDESGVFDTRFVRQKENIFYSIIYFLNRTFHPVDRSDELVVFDHEGSNADVSVSSISL
jgi:hypothetical protein